MSDFPKSNSMAPSIHAMSHFFSASFTEMVSQRTEELLAATALLNDLNKTWLKLLDGRNVAGKNTHLSGLGWDVHLHAVSPSALYSHAASLVSRYRSRALGNGSVLGGRDIHILRLVDSLRATVSISLLHVFVGPVARGHFCDSAPPKSWYKHTWCGRAKVNWILSGATSAYVRFRSGWAVLKVEERALRAVRATRREFIVVVDVCAGRQCLRLPQGEL